jgi:hypothetical protein
MGQRRMGGVGAGERKEKNKIGDFSLSRVWFLEREALGIFFVLMLCWFYLTTHFTCFIVHSLLKW